MKLTTFVTLVTLVHSVLSFERVCYLVISRRGHEIAETLSPQVCTRINLISVSPDKDTLKLLPVNQSDYQFYEKILKLKKSNPSLKVLVTLTGDNDVLDYVSSDSNRRQEFADNVVKYLDEAHLDGLDIDWEFPTYSTGRERERQGFIDLLTSLRSRLGSKYLLTAAVPGDVSIAKIAFDVKQMTPLVDYINLMTYDFYSFKAYWPFTGFNSALYRQKRQEIYFSTLNVQSSAEWWTKHGVPPGKVMVGIPTYAQSYKLFFASMHGPGAPASGAGLEYTYGEVCQLLKDPSTVRHWDDEAKVPYAVKGKLWISYDDKQSVAAKATWIRQNQYGGSMVFDLNSDDFDGFCDSPQDGASTPFKLTSLIASILT
ncbi:Acidic mammalian chitinase [Halotydeus destructor]|nr:Acidic mammalian chitinase [Halotydeus destructor]